MLKTLLKRLIYQHLRMWISLKVFNIENFEDCFSWNDNNMYFSRVKNFFLQILFFLCGNIIKVFHLTNTSLLQEMTRRMIIVPLCGIKKFTPFWLFSIICLLTIIKNYCNIINANIQPETGLSDIVCGSTVIFIIIGSRRGSDSMNVTVFFIKSFIKRMDFYSFLWYYSIEHNRSPD